jgi:hypothetical protein
MACCPYLMCLVRTAAAVLVASGVVLVVLLAGHAPAEEELPLVFQEDFAEGAGRWEPTDPSGWKVVETQKGKVYSQFKKQSSYKPPHRSPLNIAIEKQAHVSDFVLDARMLSTHEDYGHRDMCLVFGYQDASHFYYVHLGKQADDHANQIFIVNDAPRVKISTRSTAGTNWDDQWHHVRIKRNTADGSIKVYFDDMEQPVMEAVDKTFTWGRVGIGSFDDTGDWDQVVLRGRVVEKK